MTTIEEPILNQTEQANKLMKKIKKDPKLMQQYLQMQKQFQNINTNENLSPQEKLLMRRNQLKGLEHQQFVRRLQKTKQFCMKRQS